MLRLFLKSDFGKSQSWETSRYLSNFKFLGKICDEKLNVRLIRNMIILWYTPAVAQTRLGRHCAFAFYLIGKNSIRQANKRMRTY